MERVLCLMIGYCFGLFQTGYIYGRLHGIDIREHGSGNAGTTNVGRILGRKAGAVVYIGDISKTLIALGIVRILYAQSQPEHLYLYLAYAGLGVVLGHIFPFYLKFKGGKGIAAMSAIFASMDWRICVIAILIFGMTLLLTRYVSLGSILMSVAFLIEYVIFSLQSSFNWFGVKLKTEIPMEITIEGSIVIFVLAFIAIYKHKSNIVRLIQGTENKVGSKKKA